MPKILIVDDDSTTVKLLQTLLRMDGFDVMIAPRGQTALDMVHANAPDIMLIDYHLTDIDGLEVVSQLRSEPRFEHMPIVVASGLDVENKALAAGATAFLVKPFEPGSLADMFLSLLG